MTNSLIFCVQKIKKNKHKNEVYQRLGTTIVLFIQHVMEKDRKTIKNAEKEDFNQHKVVQSTHLLVKTQQKYNANFDKKFV